MNKQKKINIKNAFGKEHSFDYTDAYSYAFEIYSKNSRVLLFIESNNRLLEETSKLLSSIRDDLKLEEMI